MSDLIERVKTLLVSPDNSLWFPTLTEDLVETGWRKLYEEAELTYTSYGTARVRARHAGAPCNIEALLPMALTAESHGWELQVETLSEECARSYKNSGIRFYATEEISNSKVLEHLIEALNILKKVPTLFMTVAALVRSIHVIKPEDDDYDVSFSDPYIPFSIFISVPQELNLTNALRVAEAIVHESMHLQLTLIEQIVPLMLLNNRQYFSPWRGEYRPTQGILHALYVFRVIDEFLKRLLLLPSYHGREEHKIYTRRNEIAEEISRINSFQYCPDLTPLGSTFVQRLIVC